MFINQICSQFDERSEELKSNLENELREIKVRLVSLNAF